LTDDHSSDFLDGPSGALRRALDAKPADAVMLGLTVTPPLVTDDRLRRANDLARERVRAPRTGVL
jgi:bifunctional DNase/RNase